MSAKNIQRKWHLIDAKDKILGRTATDIARILIGKNKVNFVPYLDCGDFVVVTNASKVKVSGKKAMQKTYTHHSGYPAGLKVESFQKVMEKHPERIIESAVKGMLPQNKLGKSSFKRLKVFAEDKHPFEKQLNVAPSGAKGGENG